MNRCYELAGLRLELVGLPASFQPVVDRWLRWAEVEGVPGGSADFRVEFSNGEVLSDSERASLRTGERFFDHTSSRNPEIYGLYEAVGCRRGDRILLDYAGNGYVEIDFALRRARCCMPDESLTRPWAATTFFVKIPVGWALAHSGRFITHAAGIRLAGVTWLLAATTGSGKTTTSVALAQCGADFLGDDFVILSRDPGPPGQIVAHGFPCWIGLRKESLRWLAPLAELCEPAIDGSAKLELDPCRAWPGRIPRCAPVDGILFPRIDPARRAHLEPIDRVEALRELMGENMATMLPATTAAHFQLLGDLADSVPVRRLWLGPDPMKVADALAGLETVTARPEG